MSNDWEKTNSLIGISVFVKMKTWLWALTASLRMKMNLCESAGSDAAGGEE